MATNKLAITQVHSIIGRPQKQRVILRTLGLRHMHQTVVQPNIPQIRGMVKKIMHLVTVKEVEE